MTRRVYYRGALRQARFLTVYFPKLTFRKRGSLRSLAAKLMANWASLMPWTRRLKSASFIGLWRADKIRKALSKGLIRERRRLRLGLAAVPARRLASALSRLARIRASAALAARSSASLVALTAKTRIVGRRRRRFLGILKELEQG